MRVPKLKILIAEKDSLQERLLTRILSNEGHELAYAAGEEETIRQFESQHFDLVLLGMDRSVEWVTRLISLFQFLNPHKEDRARIIVLTPATRQTVINSILEAGADRCVSLPVQPVQLKSLVSEVVRPT